MQKVSDLYRLALFRMDILDEASQNFVSVHASTFEIQTQVSFFVKEITMIMVYCDPIMHHSAGNDKFA